MLMAYLGSYEIFLVVGQSKANLKVFNELSMSSCTKVEPLKSTVSDIKYRASDL
jgi:hypothetical protein